MGLDSVSAKIYDIHGYFRGLTVSQRTPGFWGVTRFKIHNCNIKFINEYN